MIRSLINKTIAIGFAAAIATFALSSVDRAHAQGPVHDWTGFFVGGQVGYAGGEDHFRFPGFINTVYTDGILGGGHIGYQWQNPENFVFGIVGDVNFADLDGSNTFGATTNTTDVDLTASVRGKFGFAFDNFLIFGTAGLAIADMDYTNQFGASPTLSYSQTALGFTTGAGIEYAFNDWLSGLLEYRYSNYEAERQAAVTVGNFNFARFRHQLETHQIQAGFSINISKLINSSP